MGEQAALIELFGFNRWANHRVWDCVMQLSDDQFFQPLDYSMGAIQVQTFHMMQVEHWWPHFLRTGEMHFYPYHEQMERDAIRVLWDEVEAHNAAYVAQLDAEQLERRVKPAHWEEGEAPVTVRQALYQVLFHSMDHRSQTLAMIHQLGGVTIEQDFLNYLDEPQS